MPNPRSTLCWDCANYSGNCAWSKSAQPVDGWLAAERILRNPKGEYVDHSYIVLECPEFARDAYCAGQRRLREGMPKRRIRNR